ncbi:DUF1127 domain-containing protein [Mesorhizobium sp. ORS 3428]|uniref:DUF1127 domain-containing protein n=1 Tax=Mesorhizobium sp. ORS 3428 TaxID=540997 RepID=UPI0008DB1FE2|nr:hypothetical protein [Mesorhizobium sp. ORS 3428]OHV86511.1 hypothetical protein ORS3428_23925 [Mesorhizobium sp. ORS 3428]
MMNTMLNTRSGLYDANASLIGRRPGLFALLSEWSERARFREELALKARDTPHLISDMGLTVDDVAEELAKPFWRR